MNRRLRGFTLLEVLVAFVILALVLTVLTRILSLSARSLATAEHYQQALSLASSQLAEVATQLSSTSSGRQRGRLPGGYRWEADIEPYEFETSSLALDERISPMLIRVTVLWDDRQSQQISLSTIRLVEQP